MYTLIYRLLFNWQYGWRIFYHNKEVGCTMGEVGCIRCESESPVGTLPAAWTFHHKHPNVPPKADLQSKAPECFIKGTWTFNLKHRWLRGGDMLTRNIFASKNPVVLLQPGLLLFLYTISNTCW